MYLHTFLSNLCLIPSRQYIEVRFESAHIDDVVVFDFLQGFAEEDIILERGVLYPRLLWHVRYNACYKQ